MSAASESLDGLPARRLTEKVYWQNPCSRAPAKFLAGFLVTECGLFGGARDIAAMELGAGTCGTTGLLADQLSRNVAARRIRYTVSDILAPLIAAARKKLAFVDYVVIGVNKEPVTWYPGRYDIIVSTNCIPAAPELVRSALDILQMLNEDGMLCLVKHSQSLL